MHLSLAPAQSLRIELHEGTTDSVFPAVEAWLGESSDHQRAFDRIKGLRGAGRYRSIIDFLLCEVCPEERAACFAFYRGEGPRLVELRSERRLRVLESKLLVFLSLAYEAFAQARMLSWNQAVTF
ncbi:MAG: hypothetical protein ACXWP4_15050, partial [Polyangiales bacterium]